MFLGLRSVKGSETNRMTGNIRYEVERRARFTTEEHEFHKEDDVRKKKGNNWFG